MQAAFPMKDQTSVRLLFTDLPCLHGIAEAGLNGMGLVWADSPGHPRSAVMTVGDFILCGGEAGLSATRMLRTALQSDKRGWLVYAPDAWMDALQKIAPCRLVKRRAFNHRIQPEDAVLHGILAKVPADVAIQPLEGERISWCRGRTWSEDFVSQFTDEGFAAEGLGMLVFRGGEPVSGASSYVRYPGGIEIQVTTRDDCCGHGYATLASAALILCAHAHGLSATWDSANPVSEHIALKLGYRMEELYTIAIPQIETY